MTQPFEPITVVEEFVYRTLSSDPTVTSLVGNEIYPAISPPDAGSPHITHDFYGPEGANATAPLGRGIALLSMLWYVTVWNPGMDRQPLRPVGKAIQAALTGMEVNGKQHLFVSAEDGTTWYMQVLYMGPTLMLIDVTPPGVWQRIGARYQIAIQPRS